MPSLLETCEKCGGKLSFCRMLTRDKSFTYFQCCMACARRIGNAVSAAVLRQLGLDTRTLPLVPMKESRRTKAVAKAPTKRNVSRVETPDSLALRTMPYADYLNTHHWRSMREAALKRSGYACALCMSGSQLQVHHRTYERRGCELQSDLTVLCRACHERFHAKEPRDG